MEPQFNTFVTYTLSEEENKIGETFHPIQMARLQNERAAIAQNLVNLEIPLDAEGGFQKYHNDRIFLQGQMHLINTILEISNKRNQDLISAANKS